MEAGREEEHVTREAEVEANVAVVTAVVVAAARVAVVARGQEIEEEIKPEGESIKVPESSLLTSKDASLAAEAKKGEKQRPEGAGGEILCRCL